MSIRGISASILAERLVRWDWVGQGGRLVNHFAFWLFQDVWVGIFGGHRAQSGSAHWTPSHIVSEPTREVVPLKKENGVTSMLG